MSTRVGSFGQGKWADQASPLMRYVVVGICLLLLLFDGAAQESRFTTSTEGWSIAGDGIGPFLVGDGNPGGCIQANDLNLDAVWYWSAPCSFLGNKSASIGSYLYFDRKTTDIGDADPADVVMEGAGISIGTTLSMGPGTEWTHQGVQLVASAWHRMVPGLPAVTQAEMQAVMGSLTKLWIKGEYGIPVDMGWLDNVILEPVGEPMLIPLSLCEGGYLTVQGHSMINPISWQWSFPGGIPSTATGQFPPSVLYDVPGTYPVQVIIGNACIEQTVELGDLIIGAEYVIDTAFTLCYGTGYPFDGYVITEPGTYFGMLATYLGCDSAVTVHISVLPELWGEAEITPVWCPGLPEGVVAVEAFGGVPPYSLELIGPVDTISGPGPFTQLFAGNYAYVITDESGCAVTAPCAIEEPEAIDLRVLPADTLVDSEAEFQFRTSCNYPVLSYLWTPPTGLSCTDCDAPLFASSVSAGVTLSVVTQVGAHQCDATTSTWVEVRPRYYVPNSFTPDGDTYNDVFRIVGSNLDRVVDFQATIFDRNGNIVFESTSPDFEWDGREGSAMVPPGVYAWFIQFQERHNPGRTLLRGHITVVR
ncbi:MAG: gliding motility-associated C-terminal domain-containing protein [Flavobacteriales bacterium]